MSKGTYVGIRLTEKSKGLMQVLQKGLKLNNPIEADELHATILYSKVPIEVEVDPTKLYIGEILKVETWNEKTVVVKIDSKLLEARHEEFIKIGGTHDYPEYSAHVTLSYDDCIPDEYLSGAIHLIGEYTTELDPDWKSNNT